MYFINFRLQSVLFLRTISSFTANDDDAENTDEEIDQQKNGDCASKADESTVQPLVSNYDYVNKINTLHLSCTKVKIIQVCMIVIIFR